MDLVSFLATLTAQSSDQVPTAAIACGILLFGAIELADKVSILVFENTLPAPVKIWASVVGAALIPLGASWALSALTGTAYTLNSAFLAVWVISLTVAALVHAGLEQRP